ncbi:MAG: hypothetical protein ACYSWZ_22495 [Planctomycetota bacterium]
MKRYMEIICAAAILIHFSALCLWSQSVPFDGKMQSPYLTLLA